MSEKSQETDFKVIHRFADGREIKAEDFDYDRDLNEKQHQFMIHAFEPLLLKLKSKMGSI